MPIGAHDTAGDLHDALAELGAAALLEALDGLAAGTLRARAAAGRRARPTRRRSTKAEARIDWSADARQLDRAGARVQSLAGRRDTLAGEPLRTAARRASPSAGGARRARRARCSASPTTACTWPAASGVLAVRELQRAGKRPVSARDFANAVRLDGTEVRRHETRRPRPRNRRASRASRAGRRDARAAALAVHAVVLEGRSADEALEAAHERADRAAVRAIALGTLRWYLRLAPALAPLVNRPFEELSPQLARAARRRPRTRSSIRAARRKPQVHLAVDASRVRRRGPRQRRGQRGAAPLRRASARALLAAVGRRSGAARMRIRAGWSTR